MRILTSLPLAAALLLVGSGFASAADLSAPLGDAPPQVAAEQPVEWGSGWYLRGDLGVGTLNSADMNANLTPASKKTWTSGLGMGYKFNNWMRADATLDYHWGGAAAGKGTGIVCQTAAGPPAVYSTCTGTETRDRKIFDLMFNGYVDLGTWSGITPYVGLGLGLSHQTNAGQINYVDSTTGFPYVYQNWDRTDSRKAYNSLAWAAMGGVSIDVSDHTKLDIGLKYMNMGRVSYVDSSTGLTSHKAFVTKGIKVGLRYMID